MKSFILGTLSEKEEASAENGAVGEEEWDLTMSLFDNHKSESFEANLEYMYKRFGFYFPNSEFLTDGQGLLKYLVSEHCLQRPSETAHDAL